MMEAENIGPEFRGQELTATHRRPLAGWSKSSGGSFNRPPASLPLYHLRLHGKLPVPNLVSVPMGKLSGLAQGREAGECVLAVPIHQGRASPSLLAIFATRFWRIII